MLKATGSRKNLETEAYFKLIEDIIFSQEIQKLKDYQHHISTTRFQHSLNVSYYNYLICRRFKFNTRAAARAGLLHDLFYYLPKNHIRLDGEKRHITGHPKIALQNASDYFDIDNIEKDIILKHMWPCTLAIPKYKETYVIILVDKYCALMEFFIPYVNHFKNKKRLTPVAVTTLAE